MVEYGTQLGHIRALRQQGLDLIRHILSDEETLATLFELQEQRLEEGFQLYESQMFEKTEEELIDDINEELADALNYSVAWLLSRGYS